MGEGLGEVSKRFAATANFFCVQPHVVCISQHAFKKQSRFHEFGTIDLPCSGQRFYEPERTHIERAFSSMEAVYSRCTVIPIDQAVGDQSTIFGRPVDRLQGAEHPWIVR